MSTSSRPSSVSSGTFVPSDAAVIKQDTMELSGRVSPARASVKVKGEPTPVTGGTFSTTVELEEGSNVIDVSAAMPGRSTVFAAVRVTHDPRVRIPDLVGVPDEEAADRLTELGLEPSTDSVGSLFDEFRSGERRVCMSEPPPGTLVDPGSEVLLLVAKQC